MYRKKIKLSANKFILSVPCVRLKSCGQHSYANAASAATAWNNLPLAIKTSLSVETFKTNLKTYLFWDCIWLLADCDIITCEHYLYFTSYPIYCVLFYEFVLILICFSVWSPQNLSGFWTINKLLLLLLLLLQVHWASILI